MIAHAISTTAFPQNKIQTKPDSSDKLFRTRLHELARELGRKKVSRKAAVNAIRVNISPRTQTLRDRICRLRKLRKGSGTFSKRSRRSAPQDMHGLRKLKKGSGNLF